MHGLASKHPSAPASGDTRAVSANRPGIPGKLAWCVAGFLIGAAFWHFIGFWSFVSYVVLGGPGSGEPFASARLVSVASADQAPARAKPVTGARRASCITLALDRTTGETRPEPCDATTPALPHVAASGREDLALLPDQPYPTILPHSAAGHPASSLND